MNPQRFDQLLDGPLSHPVLLYTVNRLRRCLYFVVEATGLEGAAAMERFCAEQTQLDRMKAGDLPGTD
jgi:hypothetical protein